ncbi:MAG: hypothetical protein ACI8VT_002437, partial [Saprospiraceae bacterium]
LCELTTNFDNPILPAEHSMYPLRFLLFSVVLINSPQRR